MGWLFFLKKKVIQRVISSFGIHRVQMKPNIKNGKPCQKSTNVPFFLISLNLLNTDDKNTFNELCDQKVVINDCIRSQLQDLMHIRHPKRKFKSSQLDQLIKNSYGDLKIEKLRQLVLLPLESQFGACITRKRIY